MRPFQALLAVVLLSIGLGTPAGSAEPDSTAVRAPSSAGAALLEPPVADRYFLRDRLDGRTGYLTMNLNLHRMDWYRPPTRLEAALYGAGTAATLGMFVGAVGNTLGWFGEDATWIMTGALATMGAIYSGATYEPEPLQLRLLTR
jgi:hypothetical protein